MARPRNIFFSYLFFQTQITIKLLLFFFTRRVYTAQLLAFLLLTVKHFEKTFWRIKEIYTSLEDS